MDILLVVVVVAVVAAVALAVGIRLGRGELPPRPVPWDEKEARGDVVTLDLSPQDPSHPSVQRLVQEVGRRALLAHPDIDAVEVRDRDGNVLGTVTHPPPLPAELSLPADLHEPHARRSHVPSPVGRFETHRPARGGVDEPVEQVHRPFAEQFDLDERIRAALTDPDEPVEVLRSVLQVAGHRPEVRGDLVLVDGLALLVMPDPGPRVEEALARAFLRIQQEHVPRGLIVHLGWVNPESLRGREAAAPHVRHVGPEAIQRMADAVAAGADPLTFAVGPAVVR
jgi:hypothetical protein